LTKFFKCNKKKTIVGTNFQNESGQGGGKENGKGVVGLLF
jgi:hypothetical protein